MKRVLVTGAGGFIGSNLVSFLKDKGYWVRAVDKTFPTMRQPLFGKANEFIFEDLRYLNKDQLMHVYTDIDWVFHLASDMGGVGYFTAHDYYPFINNMTMDMNVLKACEATKVERLFYSSSACIYPTHLQMTEGQAPKLAEDMIYPANSDLSYGWEKLMMLRLCERAPFDARVGILHTVFGPYQEIAGERMKAPTAIATKAIKAKETGKLEIWGNGQQIRSFCYVDDAIEKIYRVMEGDTYAGPVNIGSDDAVTINEIAKMCCDILGYTPEFSYTNDHPSGVLARNCDNVKYELFYGYKNQVSTKEGFKRLIRWIQEVGIR